MVGREGGYRNIQKRELNGRLRVHSQERAEGVGAGRAQRVCGVEC